MPIFRAIYSSQPIKLDEHTLHCILVDAQRENRRDNITGELIYRADIYLQLLEGPENRVKDTLYRIAHDKRHTDMITHVLEIAPKRLFKFWKMHEDPAASYIWTLDEVADGARMRATRDEVVGFFENLRVASLLSMDD